ncbi:d-amino-acid oxidase [Fusarium coicis]|nr:d-amino-acid oxidase [Fusarium coicis]
MSAHDSIVILGAGIIGLDVALVLAERGYGKSITVIAEHLPGDRALSYTSPWQAPLDSFMFARTHFTFQELPTSELPKGVNFAVSFTTLTVNAPKHLLYLYERLKNDYGVRFVRQKLPDLQTAFFSQSTQIVFNCTGNAARKLPGVEDNKCYPTRGQVLLTHAPEVHRNIMRHGKDYETYVIPRPYSKGHVILGGYMQKGNGDGATYSYETESILERTKELSDEVRNGSLDVLAAFSGLRPSREGGARVEREELIVAGQNRTVVHNYGAGGTGFQAGYGMALDAVRAAEPVLSKLQTELKSKL